MGGYANGSRETGSRETGSRETGSRETVAYLVFDVESMSDGSLISRVRYSGEGLSDAEAIQRYRQELIEEKGTDFIPYTFQLPISVVIAKVAADFRLIDLVCLDDPEFRPHVITEHFWRGWQLYNHPTFVSFNGRSFDLPLMELAAYRYGLSLPEWFNDEARSWEQSRNRFNLSSHLDLQEMLSNHGASRINGGLNLAANLLAKPGKMYTRGDMVQDLFDAGKLAEINDYCRCDVLDTYFVFLRTRVLTGRLTLDREQQIIAETKEWLVEHAEQSPAYSDYLDHWCDWLNPWVEPSVDQPDAAEVR